MKRTVGIIAAVGMMGTLAFAGGDIENVEMLQEETAGGFYAGLGITAVNTRDADQSIEWFNSVEMQDRLGNFTFLAGYNFNAYIAVEGRYTTSFTHDEAIEMDGWSLFVKPQYPVTEDFSVYALLGYGGVTLDGSKKTGVVDVDDSTFQWGLGVDYKIMENISIFADYTWLASEMDGAYAGVDQADVDTFTIGVNYHF